MKILMFLFALLIGTRSYSHTASFDENQPILADLNMLQQLSIPVLYKSEKLNLGYSVVTSKMQEKLSTLAHQTGKCAGFEVIPEAQYNISTVNNMIRSLEGRVEKENNYANISYRRFYDLENPKIVNALNLLSESELRKNVQWLSSYTDRFNKSKDPNKHVYDLKTKLEGMMSSLQIPYQLTMIDHQSTGQKSLRFSLTGSDHPEEIIILGAHLDSINQSWGGTSKAPGADDNASGSSNILEALRVLISQGQPQRTIEFMWYAGEESGLLGSAEIAKLYKSQKKAVIAVLQLDMTLFPGEGEFTLGNVTDYTSVWLRDYLEEINREYLKVKLVEDKCGYGCSDHASWFRQGYSTLLPFEATTRSMNRDIHSANDVISPKLSFRHSMVFTKIALIFAMDLGNSDLRQPQ